MIRKPGSDKGPGFSMFGAYVCELIEGYVKLRFTHADIEVYESDIEVYESEVEVYARGIEVWQEYSCVSLRGY